MELQVSISSYDIEWLGAIRLHAITWTNADQVLHYYLASIGSNELNSLGLLLIFSSAQVWYISWDWQQ